MDTKIDRKIPARYMHEHEGLLPSGGGPYTDGNGNSLTSLVLRKGDTLMVGEHEVKGYTVLHDPRHEQPSRVLGVGRVIAPEHKDLSDAELDVLGYQFHAGSPMWEDATPVPSKKATAATKTEGETK